MKKKILIISIVLFLLTGCSGNTSKDDYVDSYNSLSQEDADAICSAFNIIGRDAYDYYDVQYVEGIFLVSVSKSDLAEIAQNLKIAGNDEGLEVWVELKEVFMDIYNAHRQALDDLGFEEIDVLLNIVNDLNHDNIIVSIAYGEVIYDYVTE